MKPIALVLLALALVAAVYLRGSEREIDKEVSPPPTSLSDMRIELADTPEERERGLSGRSAIAEDYGMLFVFDEPGRYGFWMKDMQVAIDIIWIKDTGEIIGIEREVAPDTFPDVFYPSESVRYVLETAAGVSAKKGFSAGTILDIASSH